MMQYKDYYAILGIHHNASSQEIKNAYYRSARKYHPDISTEYDAEERIKAINEAYRVLGNKARRHQYDQLDTQRHVEKEYPHYQSPPKKPKPPKKIPLHLFKWLKQGIVFLPYFIFSRLKKLFTLRKQEVSATLQLTIDDIYHGNIKTIQLPNGKTINIKVPLGISDGKAIRVPYRKNNTLLLKIKTKPHPYLTRQGQDIHIQLPITPWEAALGAQVDMDILGTTYQLHIPENSQSGKKLRLKGKGLIGKETGDIIAILQIAIPPADTAQAQAFYRQMQEAFDWNPRQMTT